MKPFYDCAWHWLNFHCMVLLQSNLVIEWSLNCVIPRLVGLGTRWPWHWLTLLLGDIDFGWPLRCILFWEIVADDLYLLLDMDHCSWLPHHICRKLGNGSYLQPMVCVSIVTLHLRQCSMMLQFTFRVVSLQLFIEYWENNGAKAMNWTGLLVIIYYYNYTLL